MHGYMFLNVTSFDSFNKYIFLNKLRREFYIKSNLIFKFLKIKFILIFYLNKIFFIKYFLPQNQDYLNCKFFILSK